MYSLLKNNNTIKMKKTLILLIQFFALSLIAQDKISVIPFPNVLEEEKGEFQFCNSLTINLDKAFTSELNIISSTFSKTYGIKITTASNAKLVFIQNKQLEKEAYKLSVAPDRIVVEASTSTGCFWALQTIRQMMQQTVGGGYKIKSCRINDKPAFPWRGFMLDEARNFQGKELVKKMLDQMALLKMNVFHWHLTDDQGWRIEIKKYPLLTKIGAWRDSTYIGWGDSLVYQSTVNGGFYSQSDIKEIVAYATKRHITVIPEIDMPGHISSAVAAYPWLGAYNRKIKVPCTFGVKYDILDVSNPKVYQFIEDVLTEITALFPAKIIHIGGDEVRYDAWRSNNGITALMKTEGLKNYADVQTYFINRISKMIEAKGCRMMGWNEVMGKAVNDYQEGENTTQKLAQNTIIQFWKGDPALYNEALRRGYDLVNSHSHYYLNSSYESASVEKVYNLSLVPEGIDANLTKHVLGVECAIWGEVTPRVSDVYYYVFPRIAAFAELGWTNTDKKNFNRFSRSLDKLTKIWDKEGIIYYEKKSK
jgi:hexosaminidase